MILIDSSVWIEAWRGRDAKLVARLGHLVETGGAALNFLIQTELLQGARDKIHQKKLRELLSPISLLPLPDLLWMEGPELFLACRQSGVNMTTIDCLLATHARILKIPFWSRDQIFRRISGLILFDEGS